MGVNPQIIAVLKIPRVSPVILTDSENITIYGGLNFALPSGPLYTTIEEYNSTSHIVYEVKYGFGDTSWMENDADGFTAFIAFSSIMLALVATKRKERNTFSGMVQKNEYTFPSESRIVPSSSTENV